MVQVFSGFLQKVSGKKYSKESIRSQMQKLDNEIEQMNQNLHRVRSIIAEVLQG